MPMLVNAHPPTDDDDSLLRTWTPVLLRATLGMAVLLMTAGIAIAHYKHLSDGHMARSTSGLIPVSAAMHGDPAALATLGLIVLTLVPLIRVAFCLLFFLRQRNLLYVAMTGYVLAVLTTGILLGRMG